MHPRFIKIRTNAVCVFHLIKSNNEILGSRDSRKGDKIIDKYLGPYEVLVVKEKGILTN